LWKHAIVTVAGPEEKEKTIAALKALTLQGTYLEVSELTEAPTTAISEGVGAAHAPKATQQEPRQRMDAEVARGDGSRKRNASVRNDDQSKAEPGLKRKKATFC
jgi:hypothetical protein